MNEDDRVSKGEARMRKTSRSRISMRKRLGSREVDDGGLEVLEKKIS